MYKRFPFVLCISIYVGEVCSGQQVVDEVYFEIHKYHIHFCSSGTKLSRLDVFDTDYDYLTSFHSDYLSVLHIR